MTRRDAMKAVLGIPILGVLTWLRTTGRASTQDQGKSDGAALAWWTFADVMAICKETGADLSVNCSGGQSLTLIQAMIMDDI